MSLMIRVLILLFAFVTSTVWSQPKKSARMHHLEAEESLSKKQLTKALESLNECLKTDPYFYDAYYTRGLVREQLGESDGALTDYNIYLEMRPDHMEALFSRAVLRYKQRQYELAKIDFLKLLMLPSGETTTVFFRQDAFASSANKIFTTQGNGKAYLYNYIGLTETKLKNYPAAISALDSAITLNPNDADQLVNRGLAKENSQDVKGALDDYQKALLINPEHSLARHNMGALRAAHGMKEDSEKLLVESIERNPQLPYPHAQLAFHRFNNGDFKSALLEYNEAIRIDPTDVEYFLNRGIVKDKLKDYEGALGDFTTAIGLKSDYEKIWFNRANVLTKLDRLPEAIEDYSLAIFYDPLYATAYYNRALDQHKLGRAREACEDLQRSEQLGMDVKKSVRSKICKDVN